MGVTIHSTLLDRANPNHPALLGRDITGVLGSETIPPESVLGSDRQ